MTFRLEVELGSMPYTFMRDVGETARRTLRQGLRGCEVIDCVVTLTHTGYWARQSHTHGGFDKSRFSTAGDFRGLTPLVLMDALKRAGTRVHEPLYRFHLEIPAGLLGAVLPVLSRLRAVPPGSPPHGDTYRIEGTVPAARALKSADRWTNRWRVCLNLCFVIRSATPDDVPAIHRMIRELAEYEKAFDEAKATEEQLHAALFGPEAKVFAHMAENDDGEVVGFALWFLSFSTWTGTHGIYLEDVYVRPQHRGGGHGKALLAELARICVERGYHRFEWSVLDWNEPSIKFYESIGAVPCDEWIRYRLSGDALEKFATR